MRVSSNTCPSRSTTARLVLLNPLSSPTSRWFIGGPAFLASSRIMEVSCPSFPWGGFQGACAQPPDDFLSDAVPVDASRLPMPLHHQPIQRGDENARLRLHLDIRAKLSGCDPGLQQLTERGDAVRLPLSGSLRQDGYVMTQIPALHEHTTGIGFRLHLLPVDLDEHAQDRRGREIGRESRLDRRLHPAIPAFRNRQVEHLFTGEIEIELPARQARFYDHIHDRGGIVARPGKATHGGIENLCAPGLFGRSAGLRHRSLLASAVWGRTQHPSSLPLLSRMMISSIIKRLTGRFYYSRSGRSMSRA